jgi:hypothetical protein
MRRATGLAMGIVLLFGCGGPDAANEAETTAPNAGMLILSQAVGANAEEQQDLAALRRVTAQFHDFETAKQAGWSTQITGCMTDPAAGGMGFHYGNPKLIDGSVRADEPELLLYEPEKNGTLRLVAVEYIVPLTAWTSRTPPQLFGRDFAVNQAFGIWALHAWVWENNPSGMFKDWNPRVSCDNAPSESAVGS